MDEWHIIPEVVGRNAMLRMAAMKVAQTIEEGRHVALEGEVGTGRRLLARSVWYQRRPGARSLFTLDCRIFPGDDAESVIFGERAASGVSNTIQLGKLNLAAGGGLLLLNAEYLSLNAQRRLAHTLGDSLLRPRGESVQVLMTCAPSSLAPLMFHPELAAVLLRVHVPALRERVEDIRAIADAFLCHESPFERILCSQALIDKFCAYEWPGNIFELRSVLRRLLLQPHHGVLDVGQLTELMSRDERCLSLMQSEYRETSTDGGVSNTGLELEARSTQ
jgi:two-component system, NtrC family, nitrogen regulation response regulator GlnG